jgi:hypothetical protein
MERGGKVNSLVDRVVDWILKLELIIESEISKEEEE